MQGPDALNMTRWATGKTLLVAVVLFATVPASDAQQCGKIIWKQDFDKLDLPGQIAAQSGKGFPAIPNLPGYAFIIFLQWTHGATSLNGHVTDRHNMHAFAFSISLLVFITALM